MYKVLSLATILYDKLHLDFERSMNLKCKLYLKTAFSTLTDHYSQTISHDMFL